MLSVRVALAAFVFLLPNTSSLDFKTQVSLRVAPFMQIPWKYLREEHFTIFLKIFCQRGFRKSLDQELLPLLFSS